MLIVQKAVLSYEINSLMTWFKLNSLEANPNKFQSMLIGSSAPKFNDLQIEVNGNVITATSTIWRYWAYISKAN